MKRTSRRRAGADRSRTQSECASPALPPLPEELAGPIEPPEWLAEVGGRDNWIKAERLAKLIALLRALAASTGKSEGLGAELAFQLACAFHPAFQIAHAGTPRRSVGRPKGREKPLKGSTATRSFELVKRIELARAAHSKVGNAGPFSVSAACEKLVAERRGSFAGENAPSLETTYRMAVKKLAGEIIKMADSGHYDLADLQKISGKLGELFAKKTPP